MEINNRLKVFPTPYIIPSTLHTVDGVVHFAMVTKDFLRHVKDLPVSPEDVFLASYAKSGTTWVSEIVWQIYHEAKQDHRTIRERILFLETVKRYFNVETKEELDDVYLKHSPNIYKTHLRYHEVPMGNGEHGHRPKYIYVARNPKDTAVSYYHHYKSFKVFGFDSDRTWDEFFELFISNQVHYGSWFNHVLVWWAHRDDSNILFLKYEDMKKDLGQAVQQIAKFLHKELSVDMLAQITDQTTFTAMSSRKEQFYDNATEDRSANSKFFRKGEVGDWRNYFTEEQNRRFDELYENKMAASGLEFEF